MALLTTARHHRSRTGIYLAIYTSAFATLVLGALLAEQMGADGRFLQQTMFWLTVLGFAGIGILARADDAREFFTADRKVASPYGGMAIALTVIGGTGLGCLTGALFLAGGDALVLILGWISGLVISGVLIMPFLRKCGAYTVPSFLGLRLESRVVRMASALALLVPCALLIAAEVRIGAFATGLMTGLPDMVCVIIIAVAATVAIIVGGLRGLTWVTVAQAIAVFFAIAVPATIVSLILFNLPIPQLMHGNALQLVRRLELTQAFPPLETGAAHFKMPGPLLEAFSGPYLQAFGNVGRFGLPFVILVIATGLAVCPALLNRAGAAPTVYECRKSMGWGVLAAGFLLLTVAAIAGFLRFYVADQVASAAADRMPAWFQALQQAGLASVQAGNGPIGLSRVFFKRDAAMLALPMAAGLPVALSALALLGLVTAALTAAAAHINALAGLISEDLIHGGRREAPSDQARLTTARLATCATAGIAIAGGLVISDPLAAALTAFALLAATLFPVVALSILWRKVSRTAAIAGMATGFAVTALGVLGGLFGAASGPLPLSPVLAAAIGGPLNFAVVALISEFAPLKSKRAMEVVRDLRLPGGEAIYDREMRLQRRKRATATM